MDSREKNTEKAPHRRGFLRRNIAAIGAIVAASMTSAAGSARAGDEDSMRGRGRGGRGPKCFLAGASIRTIDGERKVEELREGDLLPTVFGGVQAIQWIGRFAYRRSDASRPWNASARPVRIARSAIAPGVPANDLYVSAWHCLYLDGMLIPAGNLANGTTIAPDAADRLDALEYFHIKLARHDVIFAEGVACETLLAVDERAANFADYYRRHGEGEAQTAPCAPVTHYSGRRGLVASRLRSAVSPWFDVRADIDIVRDALETRAMALV